VFRLELLHVGVTWYVISQPTLIICCLIVITETEIRTPSTICTPQIYQLSIIIQLITQYYITQYVVSQPFQALADRNHQIISWIHHQLMCPFSRTSWWYFLGKA